MNFDRPGWLARYIEVRTQTPLPLVLPSSGVRVVEDTSIHNDIEQAVYYFLQPTGLLYGSPVIAPFPEIEFPGGGDNDSAGRIHMIFMESLCACLVADRDFLLNGLVDEDDRFPPAVGVALSYFLGKAAATDEAGMEEGKAGLLARGRELKRFEKVIAKRLNSKGLFGLRSLHNQNSFLFLDLYSCILWQRKILTEMEISQEGLDEHHAQQLVWRETLIKLLIAASQADEDAQTKEIHYIRHFMRSSGLPESIRDRLRRFMYSRLDLSEVEVGEMPWLVRRYCLELILMTLLADREVSEKEQAFLVAMADKLGLWQEEVQQSLVVLELFLMQHGERLEFLTSSPDKLDLHNRIQERAAYLLRKNLDKLVNEIRETRELYTLIMKATKTPLTMEEKQKVRKQLTDILKTIPALAVLALPGGGIILPVLIKLLPFNLLPSSFDD